MFKILSPNKSKAGFLILALATISAMVLGIQLTGFAPQVDAAGPIPNGDAAALNEAINNANLSPGPNTIVLLDSPEFLDII